MPHDPALVEETRAWFSKAGNDMRAGTFELGAIPPLTSDIVFHAQQAAEKVRKGVLPWHGRVYRKTHNLVEIGEACARLPGGATIDSATGAFEWTPGYRQAGTYEIPFM
jgi:HEPN domain-containing protein